MVLSCLHLLIVLLMVILDLKQAVLVLLLMVIYLLWLIHLLLVLMYIWLNKKDLNTLDADS